MQKLLSSLLGILCTCGALATATSPAHAQKLTPRLGHSVLAGVTLTRMDENFDYHTSVFNGLGYKPFVSLKDAQDFSWLAIGLPTIVSADTGADEFAFSMGLDLTIVGNIGVGATYDLIRTGARDSGLFTGYTDKRNLTFLFSFSVPLTGGGAVNAYK